jgi:hypothetical protein
MLIFLQPLLQGFDYKDLIMRHQMIGSILCYI